MELKLQYDGRCEPSVIESLHEYVFGPYSIRFWQDEEKLTEHYDNRSQLALREWYKEFYEGRYQSVPTLTSVIELLCALPYCNAVQVKNQTMNGASVLIYPEWP